MAKIQAMRGEENEINGEPPSLHGRAMDNLRFIRETMERSAVFTSVPGYGGALMGATAIGASIIAAQQTEIRFWLITWLVEAALAFVIGLFAMWQKARFAGTPLTAQPARKFAFCFTPPVIAGVIMTALFYKNNWLSELPSVWLTLYGTAVITGGIYSVRIVPVAGWCFVALGLVSVILPASYGNLMMGLGFGVLHVVFGLIVARRYGG